MEIVQNLPEQEEIIKILLINQKIFPLGNKKEKSMLTLFILFFHFSIKAFTTADFISDIEAAGVACCTELIIEGIILLTIISVKNNKRHNL